MAASMSRTTYPFWHTFPNSALMQCPPSKPAQSGIPRKRLGGDVDTLIRQEEQHRIGDLPGGGLPAEWRARSAARGAARAGGAAVRRVDQAGIDQIGADASARAEMGDVAHQPAECRFGRIVDRHLRSRLQR